MLIVPAPEGLEVSLGDLLVRLAGSLARPIDLADDRHLGLEPLSGPEIRALAGHPAFRGPVNRCMARAFGFDVLPFDRATLDRLNGKPAGRLAVLLVSEPRPALLEAAILVAAAILHKRVVGVVMKGDREKIRGVLGPAAFSVATQEAALLHPGLADLDGGVAFGRILAADEAGARDLLAAFGLAALARFLDAAEPGLSPIFARRLAEPPDPASVRAAKPSHVDGIVKLLRRRLPAWSAIIV